MAGITLIIVSGGDIASVVQGEALLELGQWRSGSEVEQQASWSLENVRIWWRDGFVLEEDHLDRRWNEATGEEVAEIIFPSRHSAASGYPCLTVHPIGVPGLDPSQTPPYGGRPGRAPPPSPRLSAWLKAISAMVVSTGLEERYAVTLETTHHGPWLDVPSLFIEIGSTEDQWDDREAAAGLAQVIWSGLGLDGGNGAGIWEPALQVGTRVAVTLGGGHYAPQPNRLASKGVWLGHMLANYAMPMEKTGDEVTADPETWPSGRWKESILEAVESTRSAYRGADVWVYLDRKSFRGWQRRAILHMLEAEGIQCGRTRDFLPR